MQKCRNIGALPYRQSSIIGTPGIFLLHLSDKLIFGLLKG